MRILLISDTHDNVAAIRDLQEEVKKERFDFVVHAGDVISPFSLRSFEFERMYISFGNNDGDREKLVQIALERGWKIGDVVEFPSGVVYHGTNEEIVRALSKKYELVVVGHSHKAEKRKENEATVVNPGEVCGYLSGKRSYAIFEDGDVSFFEF